MFFSSSRGSDDDDWDDDLIIVLLGNRFTFRWWISSPTPVDRAEDDIKNRNGLEKLHLFLVSGSALTFAFCRTFPLVATLEVSLGFSTDTETTGEAASMLLFMCKDWDVVAEDDDIWEAGTAAAPLP